MGPTRLNHAVLYVRDAETSASFYCDNLGFERTSSSTGAVFLKCAGSRNDHDLGLFSIGSDAAASNAGQGAVGTYHLAWEVTTLGELDALRSQLASVGSLVGESDHGTSKSLYAKDPDGLEFELLWAVPAELLRDDETIGVEPLDLAAEIERFGVHRPGRATFNAPLVDERSIAVKSKTRFEVEDMDPTDAYKLTTGLIVPRPIGWIATASSDGATNLAPYSFFNAVCGYPPTFVFAPAKSARRDTLANCRETEAFTVNIVSEETAYAMNATAASVDAGIDEIELAGLTAVPGVTVAPLIAEAKANFECKVTQFVEVGPSGGGNVVVFGEAVAIHVDEDLLDGTRVDQAGLAPVGRHAGNWYSHGSDLFELARPK